jgi:hypothetical protein
MKKFVIAAILVLIIVGVAAGLSYYKLYYPMISTVSEGGPGMWERESLPLNFWSSDVMPDGTTIIATDRETAKVYKSTDEGLTWDFIFQIPTSILESASLTFCDSYGNIYVSYPNSEGEAAGLWRSADGGATFTRVWYDPSKPETSIRFRGLIEVDRDLFFGTSVGPGGPCDIYKSTDRGVTWTKISSISGGKHIHTLQYNPYNGWFYAVVGDPGYSANGVWRSKDKGLTWQQFTAIPADWDIMSVGFYNDYVYSAIHWQQGQVMRLRDNDNLDATWEEVFRSNLVLQNWVQPYQRGGKTFMLTGGEDSTSSSYPVGIWTSETPPFNAGSWSTIYTDGVNTGYRGTACPSHKTSKNGWLFVANTFEGQGIRLRYSFT